MHVCSDRLSVLHAMRVPRSACISTPSASPLQRGELSSGKRGKSSHVTPDHIPHPSALRGADFSKYLAQDTGTSVIDTLIILLHLMAFSSSKYKHASLHFSSVVTALQPHKPSHQYRSEEIGLRQAKLFLLFFQCRVLQSECFLVYFSCFASADTYN